MKANPAMTEMRKDELFEIDGQWYAGLPPVTGEMRWKKPNGETAIYHGTLHDLGYGIPRHLPRDWGIKRATYDFALGYASGFPLGHVLAFSMRRLLPRKSKGMVWVKPESDD